MVPKLSTEEKLDKIFDTFQELDWSLGEFLHNLFAHRDTHRSQRHAAIVQRYLTGRNKFNIAGILESWLTSPDGSGFNSETEMYSVAIPYTDLLHVRSILTSFAAQTVKSKLIRDVRAAVLKSGGLHAPTNRKNKKPDVDDSASGLKLSDLGACLMENMKAVFKQAQGLLFELMLAVASPDVASRNGVVTTRRNRPPELAVVNAMAMVTFTRNYHARLLPLSRGILYLASHVPVDVIDINCRIGTMPSLETIKSSLRAISDQKALKIRMMGRDTGVVEIDGRKMVKAILVVFDNSQHLRRQRERRIGRENTMVIGISATFIQFFVDPAALDPLDRRRRIALNLRLKLTVNDLLIRIDFVHLRNVGALQYLSALATFVPQCSIYKAEIRLRYATRCKKRQIPLRKSNMNTLASSGKNEAIIAELKEALLDFLNQLGQTEDDFDFRLWIGGGDGMSFNNMHLVKKYLQNHAESSFQSFELMIPALQVWHLLWTDQCRIFETHWGTPLNDDPSTLGCSAKKIGRPAPANLKKVDYYPAADLLALVHDMRMLDCWRVHFKCDDLHEHFNMLEATDQLPSFEDLETISKKLYDTYKAPGSSTKGLSENFRDFGLKNPMFLGSKTQDRTGVVTCHICDSAKNVTSFVIFSVRTKHCVKQAR
ncbi:hypothetical protein C8R43DRAFT_893920 [Mycena crocata]|nr:hypothetical protein C8R43DRAFT_893920 [Mycena crocata]